MNGKSSKSLYSSSIGHYNIVLSKTGLIDYLNRMVLVEPILNDDYQIENQRNTFNGGAYGLIKAFC